MNECCANCKYLAALWYWENYPKDKKYGHCCTLFMHDEDPTCMQLYGDLNKGLCEEFVPIYNEKG